MFKRYLYHNYRAFSGLKFRLSRRLTRAGWLALAGLFVTAMLGIDTSLSQAYQTFSLLCCLMVVSFGSLWLSRPRFGVTRVMPRLGSVGEPLKYICAIRNPTGRPQRGLSMMENLPDPRPDFDDFASTPEPGEEKRNWYDRTYGYYRWKWLIEQNERAELEENLIPPVPPFGEAEAPVELLPKKRGYLRLAGVTIMCPDPFGFLRAFRRIPLPQSILILPKRYPVRSLELPGTLQYELGGLALASSVGESQEFVSLRDYRPGDSLRHIHWKSWAKIGKPIVKEFQDEFFVRHALILDTYAALHSILFEEAVSVAASFACTLQRQDSLLDLLFVGPEAFTFTAGRGLGETEQMLEVLASVTVCRKKSFSSLSDMVLEHAASISGGICIFLEWDQRRQDLVSRLIAMGKPMIVFVLVGENEKEELDPGPLRHCPDQFHVLRAGKIAEGLAAL